MNAPLPSNHLSPTTFACPGCSEFLTLKVPKIGSVTGPCPFCATQISVVLQAPVTMAPAEVALPKFQEIEPAESAPAESQWDEWSDVDAEQETAESLSTLESRMASSPRPRTPMNDSSKKSMWLDSIVAHAYRPVRTNRGFRNVLERSLVSPKWH